MGLSSAIVYFVSFYVRLLNLMKSSFSSVFRLLFQVNFSNLQKVHARKLRRHACGKSKQIKTRAVHLKQNFIVKFDGFSGLNLLARARIRRKFQGGNETCIAGFK
nr:hypothetical protein [uncultured Campylobacter sp.]